MFTPCLLELGYFYVSASDGVMAVVPDRVGYVGVRAAPSDLITLPLLWILIFRLAEAQGQGKSLCFFTPHGSVGFTRLLGHYGSSPFSGTCDVTSVLRDVSRGRDSLLEL